MANEIEKLAEKYYIELNKNNKYDDNYLSKNKTIRDFTEGFNIAVEIKLSSQTEISDEEIEDRAAEWMEEDWDVKTYYEAFIDGASWYREQLNNNLKLK